MSSNLPTGTVTFLFTDIEGSTHLWEQYPQAMKPALARHDALLRQAVESHLGQVVKTTGDGLYAAFNAACDGAEAMIAGQRSLQAESWDSTGPLRVRMALHTGEAEERQGDYYGPALNRAARLMAAASGGQMLLSQAATALVQGQLPDQAALRDLGEQRLRDLSRAERVYQLVAPGLPADFPPLKTLTTIPNNLPIQLTSFVGREREMAELEQALRAARC